jgi:hypothetical protein
MMNEVNELRQQIAYKNMLSVIDHQGQTFNTYICQSSSPKCVFLPLDNNELVDWTSENKFARSWFCENIHHSSILKLSIERAI